MRRPPWKSYRADDRLAESITISLRANTAPGICVTSHFGKLAQSACKRTAKDRLWCGSCHDPHSVPVAAERPAYFRTKCRNYHATDACTESAANRARSHDACASCHMPKSAVTDAEYMIYTHSILRPARAPASPPIGFEVVPFGGGREPERDLALASAIVASCPGDGGKVRTIRASRSAIARAPDDAELAPYLAGFYHDAGLQERAIPLYRRSLRLDPGQVMADAGLGAILFKQGDEAGRDRSLAGRAVAQLRPSAGGGQPRDGQWRTAASGGDARALSRSESGIRAREGFGATFRTRHSLSAANLT